MSKYRIAWLPGDGIGVEVMEAARIVLDGLELDAEYVHGDIGWDFWCTEGDAFPERTVDLLKNVDAALFGAITSKPVKAAAAELAPALQGQGLTYRSPIVRMRQLFDLYVCLRPCKAYPGNPLNYQEGIDLVVFRENTEDLYAGVEFAPVPPELAKTLEALAKPFGRFASPRRRRLRHLLQDQHEEGLGAHHPRGLRVREDPRPQEGDGRPQGQRRARHRRPLPRAGEGGRAGLSRDRVDDANIDAIGDVAAQEPVQLRRAGGPQPLRRHHLRPVRPDGGRARLRLLRATSARSWRSSSRPTARPRSTPASTR